MERAWSEGIQCETADDSIIRFRLASNLHQDFFEKRFQPRLKKWFDENSIPSMRVHARVDNSLEVEVEDPLEEQVIQQARPQVPRPQHNPMTLDSFVVGASNELAYNAALLAANSPGIVANPLFIHGSSGLGKSHLASGICHQRQQSLPGSKTMQVSGEQFLNEFVTHIRSGQMDAFRKKYRQDPDLLVIDDIHTIGKGEKVQEELFNTLNHYFHENKQVVITCDQKPSSLRTFADRVRTRLAGGVILEVGWPDYQLRESFIRGKLEDHNFLIDEDLISNLALKNQLTIRELGGLLNTINLSRKITGTEPSPKFIERMISGYEKKESSLQSILNTVANHYNLMPEDLISKKRTKNISHARHVYMLIARECEFSSKEIGRSVCRDHTTVLSGSSKIKKQMQKDLQLKDVVEDLLNRLRSKSQ